MKFCQSRTPPSQSSLGLCISPISEALTSRSIDISESRERATKDYKPRRAALVNGIQFRKCQLKIELTTLDWHTSSVQEVTQRLSTSITTGLDSEQVIRKRRDYGKNEPSPPPSRLLWKLITYVFGGFGTLLIVAGILCCVAWKPLGEPAPQVSNLALGVVLFIVAALQAFFNGLQVGFPL